MQREMLVVPYDSNWKIRFKNIKLQLVDVFGGLTTDIQHIGSTAIIGMSAKPIIDVIVIVKNITKVDMLNDKMSKAGYIPKGENGIAGRRYFIMVDNDGINHIQHIHCYEKNNQHVIDELMFRDYLNVDKEAFDSYESIKMEAAHKYRFSPLEYTEYKSACVNELIKNARMYFSKQT